MKRALALLAALCMVLASAAAEEAGQTRAVELTGDGLTIYRVQATGETETQQFTLDYPAFESEDPALAAYLTGAVTDPLLALQRTEPMNDTAVYAGGNKDVLRMSFFSSLDFEGLLSVEASVGVRSADQQTSEMLFFYRLIDLNSRRELTVYDLFDDSRETVDAAIRGAVFEKQSAQGLAIVTDVAQVPAPNSYFVSGKVFRCLYAAGTVSTKATVVDIPWEQLSLTQSPVMHGVPSQPADAPAAMTAAPADTATDVPQADAQAEVPVDSTTLAQRLTASDWLAEGQTLRFLPDGTVTDPTGGEPLFTGYRIAEGMLRLDTAERPDQAADAYEANGGLLLRFEPEISDFDTVTLMPTQAQPTAEQPLVPAETEPMAETLPPDAVAMQPETLPPAATATPVVATPTPMPLTGEDADIAAFLTQGLWKPIGTDGSTYYQFMPDGKLLTIQVTPYTLEGGSLVSDALTGTVSVGGTAFTLVAEDGGQVGFVLNRSATPIAAESFVTASPTPVPTPTPEPTPTPTPSPTPTPTPEPTPTLSPYEQASASAPSLAVLSDAAFDKRQTLKVYSAPDEKSYRDAKAQVTTDESVQIFGVSGNWVLVSYKIGNGSRGRIGYIDNSTLANPASVAQLALVDIPLKLTKKANATDDPLNGKSKLFEIGKDAEVRLLAFLGSDWAYVQTQHKDKVCRVFIPRSALTQE